MKNQTRQGLCVAFFLFVSNTPCFAYLTEADFLSPIPNALSATRIYQPVSEAPASMSVIDREMLLASGASELVDVLRLVPGFQVAHATGTIYTASYHGSIEEWSRGLQVLIDGRAAYLPLLSAVDWATLGVDIQDIQRIEVVRGTNAPTYGANAFRGVVNIITRLPFEDRGVHIRNSTGSRDARSSVSNIKNQNNPLPGLSSRKWYARYADRLLSGDYRVVMSYAEDPGFDGENDYRYVSNANIRWLYDAKPGSTFDYQFYSSYAETGRNGNDTAFDQKGDRDVTSLASSLLWRNNTAPGAERSVRFYHNYYKMMDMFEDSLKNLISDFSGLDVNDPVDSSILDSLISDRYNGLSDGIITMGKTNGLAQRYDLEYQQIQQSLSSKLVWGSGMRIDSINSRLLLSTDETLYDSSARVFANYEKSFSDLIVNGGIMLEFNQVVGLYYSPRLALNYRVNSNHTIRAIVNRAMRSPSLLESEIEFAFYHENGQSLDKLITHDPNMKPETLNSFELGYLWLIPSLQASLDLKFYQEKLRNRIIDATWLHYKNPNINHAVDSVYGIAYDPFVWRNGAWQDTQGFEADFRVQLHRHFRMSAAYAYAQTEGEWERYVNLQVGDSHQGLRDLSTTVPEHTVGILAIIGKPHKLQSSLGFYRMTDMKWLGIGEDIPAYNRYDLRFAKSFRHRLMKGDLALTFQNLFDEYFEFQAHNEFKTNVYLELALSY
ncbi:MAG: TonB-dependent receptor [Gammaproteobacteria bacterium]|nr:TonB-dependent receptor [Gammaproteobacteria bacterium]